MDFVNIGFGNAISKDKVVAVLTQDSAPIKRIIQDAKEKTVLIDATCGRKTKSVIVMNSGHVILSGLQLETITNRLSENE